MWFYIKINKDLIITKTEKATLIKMPEKCELKDYTFWHPNSVVRENEKNKEENLNFSFTDQWKFKIFKQEQNEETRMFETIDEKEIDSRKMFELFDLNMDEMIEKINKRNETKSNEKDNETIIK